MKKIFLLLFSAAITLTSIAQSTADFDISKDEKTGSLIYKGLCSLDDLHKESSFTWLAQTAATYNPDKSAIRYLKQHAADYSLIIFMGTWCDDTHYLLPRLYKTMQLTGFTDYKMYGVDRSKQAKYKEEEQFKVINVPTIIIYKKEKEIGRIVEAARESIEQDLVKIIKSAE